MKKLKKTTTFFFTVVIFLVITIISQASFLYSRYLPFAIGIILIAYSLSVKRNIYNHKFIWLVCGWLVINLLAIIFHGVGFFVFRLIINTVNFLFLPYLLIKNLGFNFWIKFEKIVFFLTIFSLPIYFLSLILPNFFSSLVSVFERTTNPNYLGGSNNYWSSIIYTHLDSAGLYSFKRNCGFMWEPGSFSMLMIWAIAFNWLFYDKSTFNKRIIIYIVALATTFSTGGYLAFGFLLAGKFIKRITLINISLVVISTLVFYYTIYRLNFISGKIEQYVEVYESDPTGESGYQGSKVNRLQGGMAAFNRTVKFPIGYGLVSDYDRRDSDFAYGVNGLGTLLEIWGFVIFPVIIYLIYRSLVIFGRNKASKTMLLFYFGAILVVFFSNPVARNPFLYLLALTPLAIRFITKRKKLTRVP